MKRRPKPLFEIVSSLGGTNLAVRYGIGVNIMSCLLAITIATTNMEYHSQFGSNVQRNIQFLNNKTKEEEESIITTSI